MARTARVRRETGETRIDLAIDLDGTGRADVATGVGFFDHMLTLLARHSLIDLTVKADGDLHVDAHHTVEDVGICFGKALAQALGDKAGIRRYGDATRADGRDAGDGRGRPERPAVLRLEGRGADRRRSARSTRRWRRSSGGRCRRPGRSPCTSCCTTAATRTTSSRASSRRRRGPCARPSSPTRAVSGVPSTKGVL